VGATWDGEGTNFALFAEYATRVELCLFDGPDAAPESERVALPECANGIWHGYLPDVRPGTRYGYRVHGGYVPLEGHRHNPAKLLLDPYARAITESVRWNDAVFGYVRGAAADSEPDPRDSAPSVPRSVVVDPTFQWGGDRHPRTPWHRTVIYECHVRGMTMLHPEVPERLRGTYLGLATDPVIEHLRALGVTAVELLPVHHRITEGELEARGLTNYWGYNSIGYFAPDARFATGTRGEQVAEFKSMVKRLHRAGIEVILDVVYNHTAEGGRSGPTLSFRGICNTAYYRLEPADRSRYVNLTGCGNTINTVHPRTLQLIVDSLRYWATEMHVDGFRFDLAPTLVRSMEGLDRFFEMVQQDPTLAGTKLIAEPWHMGEGGYQVGAFPPGWSEWNGKYRDTVRRFWRGATGTVAELAYRLSGSSDLYSGNGRGPEASINYLTCHDGFTLQDLVSYERKHNEANGEENRDGTNDNHSRNWGIEGPTDDVRVRNLRERAARNLLATLAFSQGVPMLSHGDEIGRTQLGNNNAYCQDSELTWMPWTLSPDQLDRLAFARQVFDLRRRSPVLRRRRHFRGQVVNASGAKDVTWLGPDGDEMTDSDWKSPRLLMLGMLIRGEATDERDEHGHAAIGKTSLLILNAGRRGRDFMLPKLTEPGVWVEQLNTAHPGTRVVRANRVAMVAHSLILLRYAEER
jgi:glycogen operon protein